jgi:hypothetical protein
MGLLYDVITPIMASLDLDRSLPLSAPSELSKVCPKALFY